MSGDTLFSQTPTRPPFEKEDRQDWLRLLRSRRVGITTFWRLMAEFGTASSALEALPDIAEKAGIKNYEICPETLVEEEVKRAKTHGATLVCHGDMEYPAHLADVEDPPPLLWCMGDVSLLGRPTVALVGARNASSLGTRMARNLSAELGDAGFVIVSGLARGIDAIAHSSALTSGTIAVMAGGVDTIYPSENTDLAVEIAEKGLRVSDQPMGVHPQARHFPARNRIISGMSQATVVVEAAAKSGSLITARCALDQGRDVLAVPGHPFDGRASGCNMLLRDGAVLVRSAADIIEHIGAATQPKPMALPTAPKQDGPKPAANLHVMILEKLGPSPVAEDQLIRDLQVPSAQVAPLLVQLELEGQIVRQAGGLLSRAG